MWNYNRLKHTLCSSDNLSKYPQCYSGHGEGLNNPLMSYVHDVGPLPPDIYDMIALVNSPHTGPNTIVLKARGTQPTYDRDGFRIHGDNAAENYTASDGCVVLEGGHNRLAVWNSGDRVLQVE